MGIIFRQSVKSSIYSYIGVAIGFVTVGFLMPKFLSQEEIGLRMQIQSYSFLISSIIAFGIPQTIVRMFPHFANTKNKDHGILSLLGLISFSSTLLFAFGFQYWGHHFFKSDIQNSAIFAEHYHLILPFTIATLFFISLDGYASAIKESTVGTFFKDVVLRIGILIALSSYIYFDKVDYTVFINVFTALQYIPVLGIMLFLSRKGMFQITPKITFPSLHVKKEFFSVSLFNWVNIISGVAVVSIDSIMLSKLTGSADVGIYTTVSFFASLMIIPIKGLGKITNSVVAEHFKNGDLKAIKSIYDKTAINFLIIGMFLFGNLLLLIPFIFNIILTDYSAGIGVLVFIGMANLFKMATGVKFIVIGNSKFYKWNTLILTTFIISLIITNFIFIPIYGISGAAIASMISSFIHQLIGMIFVKTKFNFWPFDKQYGKAILIFAILFIGIFWIPIPLKEPFEAILKSGIFSIAAIVLIWKLNMSSDLNHKLGELIESIKNR
ncbi:MAG: O-antigen/teichoic acid export membrane protein [Salibacteraceae bacterium]|jgi:O-antigen/teichoic acid export membrane protein